MVFSGVDPRADAGWQRRRGAAAGEMDIYNLPDGYRAVSVKTESADELRDLASLRRDLELAQVYAKSFKDQVPDEDAEIDIRDPYYGLWFAALVCYGRCFGSGRRHIGKVAVDDLEDSEKEEHRYFLALRDKHVAHAVNSYEDTVVFAILTDSVFMSRQVTRTGQIHAEIADSPGDKATTFMLLCEKHLTHIKSRIHELHYEIARELHQMGLDAVYALPSVKVKRNPRIDKPRQVRPTKRSKRSE